MTFFRVAALDIDGTLTSKGRLSAAALAAIDQARRNGLAVVVVTGRIEAELMADFPQIVDHVDAMVLENGAVLAIDGRTYPLSTPVDAALDRALADRSVPSRRGEVLVAVDGDHASTVIDVIGELGLDCQIIRNRAASMVLPAGVTKGTGLVALLAAMNLSPHNSIAAGDAENDLSLFGVAEIGAAVADAVSSLRHHADIVLRKPDGAGVAELLASPYLSGARRWCPPRRWIQIGTFDDGTPTKIPGSQARVLVTGPAGSGKSYLVGLMAEQWILAGYCVLVFDPEGDHLELRELSQVVVVDATTRLPEPTELVNTLLHPYASIVLDASGLAQPNKADYLHRLRSAAEAHREQHGFPHWVLYDEAHLLGTGEEARWRRQGGYVLSSFAPAALPAKEVEASHVVLDLTDAADSWEAVESDPLRRATVRIGSGPARPFTVAVRRTAHVRHRHKYADVSLPREQRFYFRTADGQSLVAAATMREFSAAVRSLNAQALQFPLERGDFSRWLDTTIADTEMAAEVAAWEDQLLARRAADLERIRQRLVRAVEERYLAPDRHG